MKMGLALDEARREAFLEEVPAAAVAVVEPLRIEAVQPMQPRRKVFLPALGDHVEVRSESAPSMNAQTEHVDGLPEKAAEVASIDVVDEDVNAARAAGRHVVRAVREIGAWTPWHGWRRYRSTAEIRARRVRSLTLLLRSCCRDCPWDMS
ncbi:MAG TPA: hypothetical protein VFR32_04925 [Gaiellaceae bacterium]|nr:hypothetical protein [Gaiellaceae bacterium]